MSSSDGTDETTLNDSHSVTVPSAIRERLDISAGDKLRWTLTDEGDLHVEVVTQRYGALPDLEPVDVGEVTNEVDLEREFGLS